MWVTAAAAVTNATGCRIGQESGLGPSPGPGPIPRRIRALAQGVDPAEFARVVSVVLALAVPVLLVLLVLAVLSARVGVGSAVVTAALPPHAVSPGMRGRVPLQCLYFAAAYVPRGGSRGSPQDSPPRLSPDSKDAVPASPVARS
ncbi:hypothetical protein GCM10010289_19670 [Streptomyces violascens]|uniref:Uncharacterized protein n=1 Tax=Streptomyces violascens TaxID=67381 RepID=A0ABQ3QMB6_9ACTN|nr:hypothetical protein GCM10010289_19670 [Streptomyces violascens]GHI38411.1 hypothetical protein Sviol_28190 [Streptomyces violascens]